METFVIVEKKNADMKFETDKDQTEKEFFSYNGKKIYHPGTFPSYLDVEDFVGFLSHQPAILDQLEILIIGLERGDLDNAPNNIKRLLHTMKGESGFLALNEVQKICHRVEDLLSKELSIDFAEVLLQVKDWLSETFAAYAGSGSNPVNYQKILDGLSQYEKQRDFKTKKQQSELDDDKSRFPKSDSSKSIDSDVSIKKSITINLERLDKLVDLIGELVIAEAMVTQNHKITSKQSQEYATSLKVLRGITKELQDVGLGLRMVPLKTLFNRMIRLARDLSKKHNKPLQLKIKGETTELDKNLVEGLSDPLIHIIRNSIDHGIEQNPQDRLNANKPEMATITLEAYHKGGNLHIEITDDGRGIDKEKLVDKAISAGLIQDTSQLDEKGILNLIFLSGLSTAEKITNISGRGVGMDVVKDRVSEMNGKIEIQSEQKIGTTLHISLPLTLAIMDGMVVRIGEQQYVIPTLSVITALRPVPDMVSTAFNKNEFVKIHDKIIPLFKLYKFFNLPSAIENVCDGIVVIVEDSGIQVALMVDELVTKQNIVRKDLGAGMQDISGISGGTIMSNGEVCLILDVNAIVLLATKSNY